MSRPLHLCRWAPIFAVPVLQLVAGACASFGSPGPPLRYPQSTIAESEITMTPYSNVYDLVQRLRPNFLVSGNDPGFVGERLVYVNGMRVGGIEKLRAMRPVGIREIRLLTAGEAIRLLGRNHRGGALLITARPVSPLENQ